MAVDWSTRRANEWLFRTDPARMNAQDTGLAIRAQRVRAKTTMPTHPVTIRAPATQKPAVRTSGQLVCVVAARTAAFRHTEQVAVSASSPAKNVNIRVACSCLAT